MKKWVLLLSLFSLVVSQPLISPFVFAYGGSDTANIHMRIAGASGDNRYFLCLQGIGCLSILAGDEGKIYPIYQPIAMDNIYVTDAAQNYRVSGQGLPSSCQVTVNTGQTITISGNLTPMSDGSTAIEGLHCEVA